jgi:pimeloyl-ACP methyl ester carboxylesterase
VTTPYERSMELVAALQAADDETVVPACRTRVLTHGDTAPEVVVCFHGFTASPSQFREVAEAFFSAGANVLVPRVPHHGLVDPFNRGQSELTAELLEAFTDAAIDAAAGLGERMKVVGLSLGGLLACYAAKMRPETHEAVALSPFIQPKAVPEWADSPFDGIMKRVPDTYSWWNPAKHEREVAGYYTYPKFSLRAIAAQLDFRHRLEHRAPGRTDHLDRFVLVVNDNDIAIRNDVAKRFVEDQLSDIAEQIDVDTIEKSCGFVHDVVEPMAGNRKQMDAVRERVWPVLGLQPPEPGTLGGPPEGGGYFADLVADV